MSWRHDNAINDVSNPFINWLWHWSVTPSAPGIQAEQRVSMGLTDSRKTAKNLADSRKNWKILTVSRK